MKHTTTQNKKLLFRIGALAGFYSEYNNMVLAILYCKKHNIDFLLCSKYSNIAYKKGWQDYFEPFCKEINHKYDAKYNVRNQWFPLVKREWPSYNIYKFHLKLHNVDLLTQDVFADVHNQPLYTGIIDDCRDIDRHIYKFNAKTKKEIEKYFGAIDLSMPFISMHIRRGDKIKEANDTALDVYFGKAAEHTSIRRCFIFSDDYSVIEEAKAKYPEWDIFTITKDKDTGYNHSKFESSSKDVRRERMLYLFANVEIMAKAEYFFGTLSSNIGMYMYWRMPDEHCIGVDFKEWKIWYSV